MSTFLVHDMSGLLAQLATGIYEVRPGVAPVSDGNGRYSPGTPAPTDQVRMSVQSLSGKEAQKLPEGEYARDWRVAYGTYALRPADTVSGKVADVVVVDGDTFEVVACEPWESAANMVRAELRRQRR